MSTLETRSRRESPLAFESFRHYLDYLITLTQALEGLSLAAFSKRHGFSKGFLPNFMHGRRSPNASSLARIIHAFGLSDEETYELHLLLRRPPGLKSDLIQELAFLDARLANLDRKANAAVLRETRKRRRAVLELLGER